MKKKKLLFIVTHTTIFRGFFQSEIKNLSKIYDIYLLVYKYGFDNQYYLKEKKGWFKYLGKNKVIKKIFFLDQISYTSLYKTLKFNLSLIYIIKKIKYLDIDIFLFPNGFYYWEEILLEYFKKKKFFVI